MEHIILNLIDNKPNYLANYLLKIVHVKASLALSLASSHPSHASVLLGLHVCVRAYSRTDWKGLVC